LEEAKKLAEEAYQDLYKGKTLSQDMLPELVDQGHLLTQEAERLRWFVYPAEVVEQIKGKKQAETCKINIYRFLETKTKTRTTQKLKLS
jgi:hypothetical protein